MPTDSLLQVQALTLRLQHRGHSLPLFQDASLHMAAGEIVGLVGPSGSGKSMLASCITQSLPEHVRYEMQGDIILNAEGKQHFQKTPKKALRQLIAKQMGFVLQDPGGTLNPVKTCGNQLIAHLRRHTQTPHSHLKNKALDELRLVGFAKPERIFTAYPHQLSGGEQQRVAISLAISHRPALLIADEATSSLDSTVQKQLLDLVLSLNQSHQMAMLVITHQPSILRYIGAKSYALSHGKILQKDTKPFIQGPLTATKIVSGSASTPIMQAQSLEFCYSGKQKVLRNLDFTIHSGDIWGIVGESGSGKSTLAKIMAGLYPAPGMLQKPASGEVQMVFQSAVSALNPLQTAGNSLHELLHIHRPHLRKEERKKATMALLEKVGLSEEHLSRKPVQLSGGQQQRLCLAKALACQPRVLICDEFVSALDAPLKHQMLRWLQELHQAENTTIVFITHELALLKGFAHYMMVLHEGACVEMGDADSCFNQPTSPVTQRLLEAQLA